MNCRYCGADNRDSAKFCENCGGAIVAPAQVTTPAEETVNAAPETPVENTTPAPQAYEPYTAYQQPAMNEQGYQPYNPNAYRPYDYTTAPADTTPPANGLAIASLVCGILSLICCGAFTAIPAIICRVIAKSQGNKNAASTAGIICGGVSLALWVLGIVLGVVFSMAVPEIYW